MLRPALIALALTLTACGGGAPTAPATPSRVIVPNPGFEAWKASFRPRALSHGISAATYDRAMANVGFNTVVLERSRKQAEFTKTLPEYLSTAVSPDRVRNGRAALAQHARLLDAIEARWGVPREVVVAVWGMESNYGARRGELPVIESLSVLAYSGRRAAFFEQQLLAALKILQRGDTTPERMTGSWAGAMGHTQFIPTSYQAYAVDFTGDGRRDIWADDPADSLASTAAYLARSGWKAGQPVSREVRVPAGLASQGPHSGAEWQALGLSGVNGPLPQGGSATLLRRAGAPDVLVFGNWRPILRYNNAESYAFAVGLLADRIR